MKQKNTVAVACNSKHFIVASINQRLDLPVSREIIANRLISSPIQRRLELKYSEYRS